MSTLHKLPLNIEELLNSTKEEEEKEKEGFDLSVMNSKKRKKVGSECG